MLYSFLLTRDNFKIESAPARNTRDSRFAYQVYIALLHYIIRLSGQQLNVRDTIGAIFNDSSKNPLSLNRVATSLLSDTEVRELLANHHLSQEDELVMVNLYNRIIESSIVKDYKKKRKRDLATDVELWAVLLETEIQNEPSLIFYLKQNEEYTLTGFRRGVNMLVSTLRDYHDSRLSLIASRKALDKSLEQARLLYFALLRLPVEIVRLRSENIELAKEKYLPTADDLNPNLRFIDSPVVAAIAESPEMAQYFKANPFSWENDYFLIKTLLDEILGSDIYKEYISKPEVTFADDCEFWRTIFKRVVFPSDELAEALESKSVYWNDDLSIMGTFVLKTLRQWAVNGDGSLNFLPMFKDDEDEVFGEQLFMAAATHIDEYREMIDKFVNESKWDPDRIAFMDIVILTVAIAEILNFPKIPLPVSLNEYIEIANFYSSPRSGQFINGILFSIIRNLKEEGLLHKNLDTKV